MQKIYEKVNRWLLPIFVILFAVGMVTFSFAARYAYAGGSEAPGHVLTYTRAKLQWDSATGIDSNGAAVLKLFGSKKPGVAAGNVVAPGTSGGSIIRLNNNTTGEVDYTAVFYQINSSEKLPVKSELSGENLEDTDAYLLPKDVSEDQVVRAVSGTLGGKKLQDFDISWSWDFHENEHQDIDDTLMGIRGETVTLGLYIIVEDDNAQLDYVTPQTGDNGNIYMHTTLLLVSSILLLFLLGERKKENEEEEWAEF